MSLNIPRIVGLLLWLFAAGASGCGEEESRPEYNEPSSGWGGAILGRSVEHRPIIVERFGRTGPAVFFLHAIHGNEVPAEQCGERMRSWLLSHPEAYQDLQLAFITQVNPDGYLSGDRYNANGIDLNRNFPAANFEPSDTFGPAPASEPETRVVVDVVEFATPAAIVTVHSPLAVINYDGPAQELAEFASQATGIPVDVDLGPYPGSFGSYAGLDLQIPTVTLETTDPLYSRLGHLPWLQVEQLALDWITGRDPADSPGLTDLVVDRSAPDEYEAIGMGDSAGGRPLIAEQFGDQGKPVLVVAGLDGSDMAVLCAERFRARILGLLGQSISQRRLLLMITANPDGLASNQPSDDHGLSPDESFTDPFQCIEAVAIRDLIETQRVAAVVVLQGSDDQVFLGADGGAQGMLEEAADALDGSYQLLDSGRPGTLAAWAASTGIPSLTVAVPDLPADIDILRADSISTVIYSAVEAAP